jgi:metal-responsive CopG/Arc/MetJ family transcriptional regulator
MSYQLIDVGITYGYTTGMKTAISLPDDLYTRAERVAEQLNMNRSQLYATALHDYLETHDPASITAVFNKIYAAESSELDPALMQMALLSQDEDSGW